MGEGRFTTLDVKPHVRPGGVREVYLLATPEQMAVCRFRPDGQHIEHPLMFAIPLTRMDLSPIVGQQVSRVTISESVRLLAARDPLARVQLDRFRSAAQMALRGAPMLWMEL